MTTGRSDLVDLTAQLHHQTEKAVLVSSDGDRENAVWLPLSQIEVEDGKDGLVDITCPEWLAHEKGLI
ncbi:hypothetical protein [Fodinicurvata sediminis]|uniref:hypothetical protein n=1 Tax=Fodinicurvata sediminis TaxID=1121832 RepID=UPI0003B62B0E|nr:hypothetical protein [Fodinicurvata sediminis]